MNTYLIERLPQDNGIWRVITFEHDPDTKARAIQQVDDYPNFIGVAESVEDFTLVEHWECNVEDVPLRFRDHMKRWLLERKVRYVIDCRRAVEDARADLAAREAEFITAVEDLANV